MDKFQEILYLREMIIDLLPDLSGQSQKMLGDILDRLDHILDNMYPKKFTGYIQRRHHYLPNEKNES